MNDQLIYAIAKTIQMGSIQEQLDHCMREELDHYMREQFTTKYGTHSPRRNWHPFGKILVSDVPEAFALNPQFGKNARHSKFLPVA